MKTNPWHLNRYISSFLTGFLLPVICVTVLPGYAVLAQPAAAAGPGLTCTLDAPQITVNSQLGIYEPMPFKVTLALTNGGAIAIAVTYAQIDVTGALSLSGADSLSPSKLPSPSTVQPGNTVFVEWELHHPPSPVAKDYDVEVTVGTAGSTTLTCKKKISIPALAPPSLDVECEVPTELAWDPVNSVYSPNPFTVKVKAKNTGTALAKNVMANIVLPPDFEFTDPFETADKPFQPSDLPAYQSPDPVPEVEWEINYTGKYRHDILSDFRFVVSAKDQTGDTIPSGKSLCQTTVKGVPSLLQCVPSGVGSLPIVGTISPENTYRTKVQFHALNSGSEPVSLVSAEIRYTSGRVSLVSDSIQMINTTIPANGGTKTVEWDIDIAISTVVDTIDFECIFTDDANSTLVCTDKYELPPVETGKLICTPVDDLPTLVYDKNDGKYTPESFSLNLTIQNLDIIDHTNASIELVITNPQTGAQVGIDPTGTNIANPILLSSVASESSQQVSWDLVVQGINEECDPTQVEFGIQVTSTEGGPGTCSASLSFPPVLPEVPLSHVYAPDSHRVSFDDGPRIYEDTVWTVRCVVHNASPCDESNAELSVAFDDPTSLNLIGLVNTSGNTAKQTFSVLPGLDSIEAVWDFKLLNPNTTGTLVEIPIYVSYKTDQSTAVQTADMTARIEPTTTVYNMLCNMEFSDTVIAHGGPGNGYLIDEYTVLVDLINNSTDDLTNVVVTLDWQDASGFDLIDLLTGAGYLPNPATVDLFTKQTTEYFAWRFKLKNDNVGSAPAFIPYSVSVTSNETDFGTMSCAASVRIDTVIEQVIDGINTPTMANGYILYQNAPNPFAGGTTISYTIPKTETIRIVVYDALGREAAVLFEGRQQLGQHSVRFNPAGLGSGLFFYTLEASGTHLMRPMLRTR